MLGKYSEKEMLKLSIEHMIGVQLKRWTTLSRAMFGAYSRHRSRIRSKYESLISSQSHFQMQLGETDLRLRAMETLLEKVFSKAWDSARSGRHLTETGQSGIRALGSWVTSESLGIVTAAFQSAGGSALQIGNSLQKCFRDMYASVQHFVVRPLHIEDYGAVYLNTA